MNWMSIRRKKPKSSPLPVPVSSGECSVPVIVSGPMVVIASVAGHAQGNDFLIEAEPGLASGERAAVGDGGQALDLVAGEGGPGFVQLHHGGAGQGERVGNG